MSTMLRSALNLSLVILSSTASLAQPAAERAPVKTAPSSTDAAQTPVEIFHAALIAAMKGGAKLGYEGRKARLSGVIKNSFDLPGMAKLMVGPSWTTLKPDEQERIISTFSDWTIANYASQFSSYDGEAFRTLGQADGGRGTIQVKTELALPSEKPVSFIYRVRLDAQGRWKIIDILLDGTLSQLATRRAEFSSVLKEGGAPALIKVMQQKISQLSKG